MSNQLALASNELGIKPILRRFLEVLGLTHLVPSEADLELGAAQIEAALRRVAVEAEDAEAQGLTLTAASSDDVNFPTLNRVHLGVRDIPTMALRPEMIAVFEKAFDGQAIIMGEQFQIALGQLVIDPGAPKLTRTLARVALFQWIRIALIFEEYLSGRALVGQGLDVNDLDVIAEEELAWWIETRAAQGEEIRPLNVLVGSALVRLEGYLDEVRDVLSKMSSEIIERLERREEFELRLRRMDTADALLIRNSLADSVEEQQVTIERLQEQHPLALGGRTRAALDQQVHRLKRRAAGGELPERRAPALIDLLERRLKEAGK